MARPRSAEGDKARKKIVKFIEKYVKANGFSPTFREIGDAVGLASTSSVSNHLLTLSNDGVLTYNPMMPRTIRILKVEDGAEGDES